MKVLLLHNYYQSSSPSGEDAVFRNEARLLATKGINVLRYERSNDDIGNPLGAVSGAVWSRKTYNEVSALIKRERPDIAHFHNIWYLISPSAYYACKDAGVPVVQTLHNYRMFCASGLLLRDGRICEDCIGRAPWRGAAYGCFRNSRLYAAPVVAAEFLHKMIRTWDQAVDAYIALTGFGKRKFIECGLPGEKIYVKPNFLDTIPIVSSLPGEYAIFIGRLSREKGLDVLIEALHILASSHPLDFTMKIVGDGPLKEGVMGRWENGKIGKWEDENMRRSAGEKTGNVEFTGRKSHEECMELLQGVRFLVLPSVCYENFPLAIIEAFASSKPVIASKLGAMAEIVAHGKTGLLFEPGNPDALADAIRRLWEDEGFCREMGANARAEFEAHYTADRNFEMMMTIYSEVMKSGK